MTAEATTPHGLRLRRLRKASGYTQVTLSQAARIGQVSLSKYEHGGIPRADVAIRIARLLGTSVEFLWGDAADDYSEEQP